MLVNSQTTRKKALEFASRENQSTLAAGKQTLMRDSANRKHHPTRLSARGKMEISPRDCKKLSPTSFIMANLKILKRLALESWLAKSSITTAHSLKISMKDREYFLTKTIMHLSAHSSKANKTEKAAFSH